MHENDRQIQEMINMLQSPKASKRYEACEELRVASTTTPEAILALQNALKDPDPLVADAAKRALSVQLAPKPPPGSMETNLTPVRTNKLSVVSLIAGILSPIGLLASLYLILYIALGGVNIPSRNSFGYNAFLVFFYFLIAIPAIAAFTAVTAGIISLAQIKKSLEDGKGCAIAGIILGGLTLAIYLLSRFYK